LKLGVRHPQVLLVRKRLKATGELAWGSIDTDIVDVELDAAIRLFQSRHGINDDGAVGNKETRPVLNVPAKERLERINHNLTRPSILPEEMPDFYVLVNVPAFKLYVIENDRVVDQMKVIAGKVKRQTPEFADMIKFVVFNPYWHVPTKLAHKDKIPDQVKNPNYFQSVGIRVFETIDGNDIEIDPTTVDWTQYSWDGKRMPYKLRQDPGPKNFLGEIKFIFPNPFGVYLHDTPSKHLFAFAKRTYSSGCVRIENPPGFAETLLSRSLNKDFNDAYPWKTDAKMSPVTASKWNPDTIQEMIDSGERKWVRLPQEVPVYIVYYTTWVDDNDVIHFYPDVYKREPWSATQVTCNYGSINNTCDTVLSAEQ